MQSQEANKETQRLSIEQCKKLLGEDGKLMSDKQIEELRDALYVLGDTVLDNLFSSSNVCHDHE